MAGRSLTPFRSRSVVEPYHPTNPIFSFYRQANRLFEDVFREFDDARVAMGGMLAPHVDVTESEQEARITAELPGVKNEDIDITVDGDILTIRAEKRVEKRDENDTRHLTERSYGTFQRSLRMPQAVDPDQVHAHFDRGVLTILLPRTGLESESRRITIESGPPPEKAHKTPEVKH
jgi:HSP20 family protein